MKKYYFLFLATTLLFACTTNKLANQSKGYVPKNNYFKGIYFGMSESEFLKLKGPISPEKTDYDFREVYLAKTGETEPESVVYYFDNEKEKPLYELIIIYSSEEKAREEGDKLLGERNFENNTEWFFDRDGDAYDIKAWNFKNKLVIAALVPGSEWYDEVNGE